jgi:hypothetical protein
MPAEIEKCATCRFWDDKAGEETKEAPCRWNPPSIVITMTQMGPQPVGMVANMKRHEGCGRHRFKKGMAPAAILNS